MINLQECTILIMNMYSGQIPKDHIDLKDSWSTMANSLWDAPARNHASCVHENKYDFMVSCRCVELFCIEGMEQYSSALISSS